MQGRRRVGRDWWFKVGPERLAPEGMGKRDDWLLRANERWQCFGTATGFNILDPIKGDDHHAGSTCRGFARRGSPRRSSKFWPSTA
jgi:hypothetical protein